MSDPASLKPRQPIFNAPTGIVALLGVMAAIHFGRMLLAPEQDGWLIAATAFIPARFSDPEAAALPGSPYASVTSWFTHMLMHGSVLHLMFNSAWLLAFGGAVAHRIGALRCILFAALCGCVGAALFLVVNWGLLAPMVGASGAVLGLMGASIRFLYPALDLGRGSLKSIHSHLRSTPLMPLKTALTDTRVILTTLMLIILNFAGAFGFGPGTSEGAIAWEAHAGGYLAGFLLYGWFDDAVQNDAAPPQDSPGPESEDLPRNPTLH
jgi:membrane associated rhomboid family serine protease